MDENKKILVGKIVAPQGVKGEVRVQTYSQLPSDFKNFKIISDKFLSENFHFVRSLNNGSNVIIARIDNVIDRNQAELLRGTELFIYRNNLPQPNKDEFYQFDLIGFSVIRDNNKLGTVDGFQNFGAGDIIELDNGNMVSFIGADVDFDNQIIYVK